MSKNYSLDQSIGYKLFHASRLISKRLNQNFNNHGFSITDEQWQILSRLYEVDGLTQNELAIRNERDQGSISRLVDNLIKKNLVFRKSNEQDKRIKHIYLTEKGKRIQKELETLAFLTISQATENLVVEELDACLKGLDQIRDNLS